MKPFSFYSLVVSDSLPARNNLVLFGSSSSSSSSSSEAEMTTTTSMNKNPQAEATLMRVMDMNSILEQVSRHAGTRQGRSAILKVSGDDDVEPMMDQAASQKSEQHASSRQRWARADTSQTGSFSRNSAYQCKVAVNLDEARHQYDLIEQATLILEQQQETIVGEHFVGKLPIPPLYAADSGPFDTKYTVDTDDDEWLEMPVPEWSLEDILRADQIVQKLLNVYGWAASPEMQTWTPLLAEIGMRINATALQALNEEIQGAIEVKRAQTIYDPSGRSSFVFLLSSTRFPVLEILRNKEQDLVDQCKGREGSRREKELANLRGEIMERESAIQVGLASSVAKLRRVIDDGLRIVTELDTIMARAAYGISCSGLIPAVQTQGVIDVKAFRHPLLPKESVVAIDLCLSPKSRPEKALIISGVNGGGKTAALKSFGIVALFAKLGIPIPASARSKPRVDFYRSIHALIGDQQNLFEGQSTFMASMSQFSELVRNVEEDATISRLVLLDELGSGTDQNAGGAIAQAILEKLLEAPQLRVVATTHNPRLKALSFDDPAFGCAAVQLESFSSHGSTNRPSFDLQYGIIADSFALNAASRCTPSFSQDVMTRATELVADSADQDLEYLQSLRSSLEKQLKKAKEARMEAESVLSSAAECQSATRNVAIAHERHFGLLEQRLQKCYDEMRDDSDAYMVIGNTLSEVGIAKKRLRSEADFLGKKGLRLMPDDHTLSDGETVTIIAEGEWHGEMASVYIPPDSLPNSQVVQNDVLVIPSLLPWIETYDVQDQGEIDTTPKLLIFKRYELAIWDYESALDGYERTERVTSVSDSKRKLNRVLSTLGQQSPKSSSSNGSAPAASTSKFKSSRERKASKKKGKKRS